MGLDLASNLQYVILHLRNHHYSSTVPVTDVTDNVISFNMSTVDEYIENNKASVFLPRTQNLIASSDSPILSAGLVCRSLVPYYDSDSSEDYAASSRTSVIADKDCSKVSSDYWITGKSDSVKSNINIHSHKSRITTNYNSDSAEEYETVFEDDKEMEDGCNEFNSSHKVENVSDQTSEDKNDQQHSIFSSKVLKCNTHRRTGAKKKSQRVYNKQHYCYYCEKRYSKISEHLRGTHADKKDVIDILLLNIKEDDSELVRKEKEKSKNILLTLLRNKGDNLHNQEAMKLNKGELIVVRRPSSQQHFDPLQLWSLPRLFGMVQHQ